VFGQHGLAMNAKMLWRSILASRRSDMSSGLCTRAVLWGRSSQMEVISHGLRWPADSFGSTLPNECHCLNEHSYRRPRLGIGG
jgi:hypothetical protein